MPTPTTWNSSDKSSCTLSNGNLTATMTGSGGVRAGHPQVNGKFYFEIYINTSASSSWRVGVCDTGVPLGTQTGYSSKRSAWAAKNNTFYIDDVGQSGDCGGPGAGSYLCFAVDLDASLIWVRTGNGNWNGSPSADPATGTGGHTLNVGSGMVPCIMSAGSNDQFTANFGASAFNQSVPSGFESGWQVPATPYIDGGSVVTTQATNVSSFNLTLNMQAAGIAVICVHNEKNGGGPTVSSVTSNNITWSQRKRFQYGTSNIDCIEIWHGRSASPLSNETVTVTLSATTDDSTAVMFAIYQPHEDASLFDSNAGLPTSNNGSSNQPQVTGVSTTDAPILAYTVTATHNTFSVDNIGSGYSRIGARRNTGGTNYSAILVQASYRPSNYSSTTISQGTLGGSQTWGMVADALQYSIPEQGVEGTLNWTEVIDTFSGVGQRGHLSVTDLADAFSGVGQRGHLSVTDLADAFSGVGQRGHLSVTDSPDTFSGSVSNYMLVNGDAIDVFAGIGQNGRLNITDPSDTISGLIGRTHLDTVDTPDTISGLIGHTHLDVIDTPDVFVGSEGVSNLLVADSPDVFYATSLTMFLAAAESSDSFRGYPPRRHNHRVIIVTTGDS